MVTPAVSKSKLPLGVVLFVLLALGTGIYFWVNRPTATKQQTEAALDQARGSSDQLSLFKKAHADAASTEGKAAAATQLATYYSGQNDHAAALKYYQEANELLKGADVNAMLGVASSAKQSGNNALAKEYYQKAIDYYEAQPKEADHTAIIDFLKTELGKL